MNFNNFVFQVFSGTWKPHKEAAKITVAIKTLREGDTIDNQKRWGVGKKRMMEMLISFYIYHISLFSFLAEARMMRALKHENVVRIFGVAVYEKPLMIIMELCTGGSLLTYLRNERTNTKPEQRLRWILQAAKGLQYISASGCIHRDVAARNWWVDGTSPFFFFL